MQGIRAFVGHSFSPTDREIVRAFVDHFNNLARAHVGGFTWDHAEEAEASPLSQKVLSKIQDKNVFIGICTRKERAAAEEKLSRTWRGDLKGKPADLQWKTSDWIIQEIGLAVGRNMSVIIFLEDGVRDPGGLYGDTEYIPFNREKPTECFDKFLQMLTRLIPKEGTAVAPEAKPAASEEKERASSEADLVPTSAWDSTKYYDAAFRTLMRGQEEQFEKIDAAFRGSIHAHGENAAVWAAKTEFYRLLLGAQGDFDKLKKLAEEHPKVPEVQFFTGAGYEEFGDFSKAIEKFEQAAALAEKQSMKASYLGSAAHLYAITGKAERVAQITSEIRKWAEQDPTLQSSLFSVLKRIADHEKDAAVQLALMEHDVEAHPSDTRKRFSLAFKHSENDNNDMALHHYLRIPTQQRDPTTWNNIGVSYGEFAMPVKSVSAFRRAENDDDTLAMANLGFKYLNAGFFDEADAGCKKALGIDGYHKNIPALLSRLQDIREEEEKKLEETLEKVKGKVAFYRQLGTSVISEMPTLIAAKWIAPEGVLEAKLSGDELRLFGSYERPGSSLGGLFGLGIGAPTSVTHKYRIEYIGRFRGRMLTGTVQRMRDGTPTILGELVPTKTLMWLSGDGSELSVMENYSSVSPTSYTLRALTS